jgi:beta-glucosidase-like glycosyl hydrolase
VGRCLVGVQVKSGEIQEGWIERACARVLTQKFAARLFDGALPDPSRHATLDSPAHRALARQASVEGAVLLINQNATLPLKLDQLSSIAVRSYPPSNYHPAVWLAGWLAGWLPASVCRNTHTFSPHAHTESLHSATMRCV